MLKIWWIAIAIALIVGFCVKYFGKKETLIMGADGSHPDILIVCLDATRNGAEFAQDVVRLTKHPERIRIGLIQRRVTPSQNVVETLKQWGRHDILSRTRITLVNDEATLMDILGEVYKHLYDDEPRVVFLLPGMRLAQDWDMYARPLSTASVHTAAMIRPDFSSDRPAFPIITEIVNEVPSFSLQQCGSQDQVTGMVKIPMTAVMSNCFVLSHSAFEVVATHMRGIKVPDWCFSAVISSILYSSGFSIVNCSYILGHMNLGDSEHLPVNCPWKPQEIKAMLSPQWMAYAGVHSPRGRLGVSDKEHELEWRWKWGDHNAQDAARDSVGYVDS